MYMHVHVDKKWPVIDGHKKCETANSAPKEKGFQNLRGTRRKDPCDPKVDPNGTQKTY